MRIEAPVANTGDVSTDMTRFRAVTVDGDVAGLDDAEVWIEEDAKVEIGRAEAADGVQTTYSLLTAQFGWNETKYSSSKNYILDRPTDPIRTQVTQRHVAPSLRVRRTRRGRF